MVKVSMGSYKDVRAVVLEDEALKAVLLPDFGSKIASIIHQPDGCELLWQNPDPAYKKTSYGAFYADGEFSGFDEMFPTISRCFYESPPWSGSEVPDHGELWTIPWAFELGREEVGLWVHGVRFPYRLEKRVRLEGSCLKITYRAVNLSPAALDFLWAGHPLFNAARGMQFIVPPGMDRVVNSVPSARMGPYGAVYTFPSAELPGGEFDLSLVPEKNPTGFQKYYFCSKMTEGWCILYDPGKQLNIGMSFPKQTVPYLGMWLNEGGYAGQYNIAPEPATGAMDRIDFARMWGMNSVLKAGQTLEWYLNISVAAGKKAKVLRENGEFIF